VDRNLSKVDYDFPPGSSMILDQVRPGWPDWANFRPMGDRLLWAVFINITDVAQNFGLLFS
jgi:hypothetical protein